MGRHLFNLQPLYLHQEIQSAISLQGCGNALHTITQFLTIDTSIEQYKLQDIEKSRNVAIKIQRDI